TRTALANEIPPQQGVQLESATTRIERDQRLLAQAAYTRQMIEAHPAIWRAVTLTLQRQVACQRAILTLQSRECALQHTRQAPLSLGQVWLAGREDVQTVVELDQHLRTRKHRRPASRKDQAQGQPTQHATQLNER